MNKRGILAIVVGLMALVALWANEDYEGVIWAVVVIVVGAFMARAMSRATKQTKVSGLAGWTMVPFDDTVGLLWGRAVPQLPTKGLRNVYRGTSHRRSIAVFQHHRGPRSSFDPIATYFAFPLNVAQRPFWAASNGHDEVSVEGDANERVTSMLQAVTASRMKQAGVAPNGVFWMEVPPIPEHAVKGFIQKRLPSLMREIITTMTANNPGQALAEVESWSGSRTPARPEPAAPPVAEASSSRPRTQERPAPIKRPAPVQQEAHPRRGGQHSRPQRPLHEVAPLQHPTPSAQTARLTPSVPLDNDPSEILRTAPIEVQDRPALQKAKADPIAEQLENPALSQAWTPAEWSAPSVELSPIELTTTDLGSGWQPKEWTPPEYTTPAPGEWTPTPAWTPSYNTTGSPSNG